MLPAVVDVASRRRVKWRMKAVQEPGVQPCLTSLSIHVWGNLQPVQSAAAPAVVQTSAWKSSCCGATATVSPAGMDHICALTHFCVYRSVEGAALNQDVWTFDAETMLGGILFRALYVLWVPFNQKCSLFWCYQRFPAMMNKLILKTSFLEFFCKDLEIIEALVKLWSLFGFLGCTPACYRCVARPVWRVSFQGW